MSFSEVAFSNVRKVRGRFIDPVISELPTFDASFGDDERLPDRFEIVIRERRGGRSILEMNGVVDLGPFSIAAQDVLALPSYVTPLDESPTLIGFFNQIKQEHASARWLLYEGCHADAVHFSDRDVTLTLGSYGLSIEKVRVAFRMAYSLLDSASPRTESTLGASGTRRKIWQS
jgi:LA2681-like HEPN